MTAALISRVAVDGDRSMPNGFGPSGQARTMKPSPWIVTMVVPTLHFLLPASVLALIMTQLYSRTDSGLRVVSVYVLRAVEGRVGHVQSLLSQPHYISARDQLLSQPHGDLKVGIVLPAWKSGYFWG